MSEQIPKLTKDQAMEGVKGMDPDTFTKALKRFLEDPENRAWMRRQVRSEAAMTRRINRAIDREDPDTFNPRLLPPEDV